MGKREIVAGVVLLFALTGCASSEDPYDTAWANCVEMNAAVYPDGLTDARDGQILDAEEICHSTVATQGQERFTELFNDSVWVECYADVIRGTKRGACDPPA